MRILTQICVVSAAAVLTGLWCLLQTSWAQDASDADASRSLQPFEIVVIDESTDRGIPMVTLTTTDDVSYLTDNDGRILLCEPEWHGQTVFFYVHSPGYELKPDGFGYRGIGMDVKAGNSFRIRLRRVNIAERLYRVTGRGRYVTRDQTFSSGGSIGIEANRPLTALPGLVTGQDSVQAAVYRGRLHWFWGDTNRLSYPLGLFRTAGATSPLPQQSSLPVSEGIQLSYFTKPDGFVRAMVDLPNPDGVVWIDGVCVVTDDSQQEHLIAHFSRRKDLARQLEHGLLVYNDQREIFEARRILSNDDRWRFVRDHPTLVRQEGGTRYLVFGNPFPVTRVPATLTAVLDPESYQSLQCDLQDGTPHWHWRPGPPTTQHDEWQWVKSGKLSMELARFLPLAVTPGPTADDQTTADQNSVTAEAVAQVGHAQRRAVLMHSGTVHFNRFRKKWVMLGVEQSTTKDAASYLGEVWYSEADSPHGPFRKAIKVATHPGQSFYNPAHHPFFDQHEGRILYFEGTYCNTFTDSPPTPLYNYNQLMYRMDLSDPRFLQIMQ